MNVWDSNRISDAFDFFILHALKHGPLQGFTVEQHVERIHKLLKLAAERNGKPKPESLPSALGRLEHAGWIEVEGRQADFSLEKTYSLTPAGKEQFAAQQARWTSTLARFIDEGGLDHSFRKFLDRNT